MIFESNISPCLLLYLIFLCLMILLNLSRQPTKYGREFKIGGFSEVNFFIRFTPKCFGLTLSNFRLYTFSNFLSVIKFKRKQDIYLGDRKAI